MFIYLMTIIWRPNCDLKNIDDNGVKSLNFFKKNKGIVVSLIIKHYEVEKITFYMQLGVYNKQVNSKY